MGGKELADRHPTRLSVDRRHLTTDSHSDALVLFGVTGDLAHKMIFPALYAMAQRAR